MQRENYYNQQYSPYYSQDQRGNNSPYAPQTNPTNYSTNPYIINSPYAPQPNPTNYSTNPYINNNNSQTYDPYNHQHSAYKYNQGANQSQIRSEWIPIEKSWTEWIPEQKIEYKPIEKKAINYVEIQHQTDFVPVPRLERYTEYIPVDRYREEIDYMPVEKSYVAGQTNPQVYEGNFPYQQGYEGYYPGQKSGQNPYLPQSMHQSGRIPTATDRAYRYNPNADVPVQNPTASNYLEPVKNNYSQFQSPAGPRQLYNQNTLRKNPYI